MSRLLPPSRDPYVVGVVALVARLAVVAWASSSYPAVEDGHYYDVLASRLAAGHGYTWLWPDGAVTYAAHYPVGYPAMLAIAYRLFGGATAVAMLVNALLGAAAAWATYALVDRPGAPRWRPVAAGLLVALHPALLPYTVALMTEGVTAALLVVATAFASRARRDGARRWWALAGVTLGIATLVRPQSLAFALAIGLLAIAPEAGWRQRVSRGAAVLALALAVVAPWTIRNCARMHRCALVSVNGGWNLLIGTQTDSGGWAPVDVPAECAMVWDEAGKDACFERVARRRIADAPGPWLARAPAKVAVTLDYFGAAPWYLHASNPGRFDDAAKMRLGGVEIAVCRLTLLGALAAVALSAGPRRWWRLASGLAGAVAAVTVHAWPAYLALVAAVAVAGPTSWRQAPAVVPAGAALVALTAVVHAVFFGAGRYGLVVVPFVVAMAFVNDAFAPAPSRPS